MEEWESDLEDGEEGGFLKERLKEARKGLQMGSGGGKGGGLLRRFITTTGDRKVGGEQLRQREGGVFKDTGKDDLGGVSHHCV